MVNLGNTVFTVVLHLKPWLALFFVPSWFLYCQYISWIIKYALVNCRVMEFRLGIKKTNGNVPGRLTMKELDKIANIQVNCEHALQILVDFFAVINNHGKATSSYFPSLFAQWPLHSLLSSAMKRDQLKRDYTVLKNHVWIYCFSKKDHLTSTWTSEQHSQVFNCAHKKSIIS